MRQLARTNDHQGKGWPELLKLSSQLLTHTWQAGGLAYNIDHAISCCSAYDFGRYVVDNYNLLRIVPKLLKDLIG